MLQHILTRASWCALLALTSAQLEPPEMPKEWADNLQFATAATAGAATEAYNNGAKTVGFSDHDIQAGKNYTNQLQADAGTCANDDECVQCYGVAGAKAVATSVASNAACAIVAITCPVIFAYSAFEMGKTAVNVYHKGADGVDPCVDARVDSRNSTSRGTAAADSYHGGAALRAASPARTRRRVSNPEVVSNLSGVLTMCMLVALFAHRRRSARAGAAANEASSSVLV